jgi:hypothetical protein
MLEWMHSTRPQTDASLPHLLVSVLALFALMGASSAPSTR